MRKRTRFPTLFHLEKAIIEAIRKQADKEERTMSVVVNRIIKEALKVKDTQED
jgi:hypothetical protein